MADGSVRFIVDNVSPDVLKTLASPDAAKGAGGIEPPVSCAPLPLAA